MRLIDADALKAESFGVYDSNGELRFVVDVNEIDEQPTVQPVPVMTYPQVDGITPILIDWTKRETKTVVTGNPAYPLGGGGNYRCSNTVYANHIADDGKKVDAVAVVRCGECKYYDEKDHNCLDEMAYARCWMPTDFCSFGERRENDEAD